MKKSSAYTLGNLTKTNHKQTLQSDKVGDVQAIFVVDVINVKRVIGRYFFVCCGNDFNLEMILSEVNSWIYALPVTCNQMLLLIYCLCSLNNILVMQDGRILQSWFTTIRSLNHLYHVCLDAAHANP